MPEDAQITQSLVELLNGIEDPEFDMKSKTTSLKSLLARLQNGVVLTQEEVVQILKICTKADTSCLVYEVAIISAIVKNEEIISTIDPDCLIDSALFLLKLLRDVFSTPQTVKLRTMTIQTFISYPEKVLVNIATNHGKIIINTMHYADHGSLNIDQRVEMCHLLKVLDYLPHFNAMLFVTRGLEVWFSKSIPLIMAAYKENDDSSKSVFVDYLEALANVLEKIDYFKHHKWQNILESICNANEYPAIIKKLLQNKSNVWHRLWIVFIKILNVQITKNLNELGTPINSMLPVVETAFKMDAETRIRAFKCWNTLIDNFANETNESYIAKRIKLLIIPLKLNNAKTADIAYAKFETWWHFIRKFDKSERFCYEALIPFLHFLFGHSDKTKSCFIATNVSNKLKRKSLEAFVEIVGHVNCECSLDLPKLNSNVLNTKLLVTNWKHWIHFLECAFQLSGNVAVYELSTKNYMKCVMKTFVQLIGTMADNNIRRDLVIQMLTLVLNMLKDPQASVNLRHVVLTAMTAALFDGSDQMREFLKTKEDDYNPLFLITTTLVAPAMNDYYTRLSETQIIHMFKPIAFLVLCEIMSDNKLNIFNSLNPNDTLLKFWAATMDNVPDVASEIAPELLLSLMEWPLIMLDSFKEVKVAAIKWYTTCNLMYKKLSTTGFNKEISKYIVPKGDSMNYFIICVTIGVMKQRLLNGENPGAMSSLIKIFTSSFKEYDEFEELMPLTFDTVVLMLNLAENENVEFAKDAITCAKNLLRIVIPIIEKRTNNIESNNTLFIQLKNLLRAINPLLKIKSYADYVLEITKELSSHLIKVTDLPLRNSIMSTLKIYSEIVDETIKDKTLGSPNKNNLTKKNGNNNIMERAVVKEFTTPDINKIKKAKKIEPNIVNKVVENGEEYVVVQSNWKLNPKKMTENQKEKFQRKREDIPALYQDLSQSQDEFKLSAWKSDTQDTTTTSNSTKSNNESTNKSVTAEETASIIKNMPSTEVVPKIMENILHNNDQKVEDPQNTDKELLPEKGIKKPALSPSKKNTKSPRLALKDRVFRNMKNLLDKSTPPKDKPDIEPGVHTENVSSSPTTKPQNDSNDLNSSTLLIVDRPSRVKRTPKKFDDSQLFALRKRRYSLGGSLQTDSQNNSQNDQLPDNDITEQIPDIDKNDTVQKVNGIVKDVMIKGIEPLNTKDDVVEKSQIQLVEENTNTITLSKSLEKLDSVDEVDHNKVPEVDLTTSIVEKEQCKAPVIEIVSVSDPLTEMKEPVKNVVKENNVPIETNSQNNNDIDKKTDNIPATPSSKSKDGVRPKSLTKKSAKKTRIEKELAIDMVEGHPLFKVQPEKRTRKKIIENLLTPKRKSVGEKLNKLKSEATKSAKKMKEKNANIQVSVTVEETQERSQSPEEVIQDEPPCSEDVIESSQDSTITTMSVKSTKITSKRVPVVALERLSVEKVNETQDLLQDSEIMLEQNKTDLDNRDDSVFPQNKTVQDNDQTVLTENMDTELMEDKDISDDGMKINNDNEVTSVTIHSELAVGPETQEIAEADTQFNNSVDFVEFEKFYSSVVPVDVDLEKTQDNLNDNTVQEVELNKNRPLQADSITDHDKIKDLSSPYINEDQRKQDFLNNTVEISPIKIQSPDRNKTPSPETSSDFVVIKLSSPVHINGEPFEKPVSPEFFTNDKISPDKRDVSPPRAEVIAANNTSPNSLLSLKKNKPQVRPGGRAAHMLGLCVPDKLNTIKLAEKFEFDEEKKASTPARRNLRILYNTVGDNTESSESEESEYFLKLQRSLPAVDCSPVGPILKRKLSEIADEATVSPSSKRKRVSFHDPPVSTTVSVQKYIESNGLRSPQNSALKRIERQTRQSYSKSPKRLENVFRLETVLSKAVESFAEGEAVAINTPEETQTSLEVTPAMEIIKPSELNDTDPICPELVGCEDHISEIAGELSSPSMKHLFVKQVEDKIKTVGDLAKMTEMEICRLCIKAPKIKVAKKVLTDYAAKQKENVQVDTVNVTKIAQTDVPIIVAQMETDLNTSSVEIQTEKVSQCDMEVQTNIEPVVINSTQTDIASVMNISVQTDESGSRSTSDIIQMCLDERNDFVEKLSEILDMTTIAKISRKLPSNIILDMLTQNQKPADILDKVLAKECSDPTHEQQRKKELAYFTEYMSQRFDSKHLILFCTQLLQKVYDKPAQS